MTSRLRRLAVAGALAAAAALSLPAGATAAEPVKEAAKPVKNIVLVHGAFIDGSGWRPVSDILTRDGFAVSVVQQPLTGFADDVAATRRVLARQKGPVILVGHGYGGAIITEVGVDPLVAGLVFIAAHAPDKGETLAQIGARYPAPGRDAIKTTPDDYAYIDPRRFHAEFAADLSTGEAAFEASAQVFTAASVFIAPVANVAWRAKPNWYMVARGDRFVSPDLQRFYAARARSQKVEVDGASHSIYRSHPKEVAALIEEAAKHALDGR